MSRPLHLALWSVALTAVCAAAGATVRLTAKDAGRTVTLRTGDSVEVALAGNPTTGFSWQVASAGDPVLHADGEPAFKPDSRLIGSGGTATRRFRAVAPGTATLRLEYRRPWEKDVPPAGRKTFPVVVR